MASYGSSLVNKSGKRIAPKIVARRRPPPQPVRTITEPSTEASTDLTTDASTDPSTYVSTAPSTNVFADPSTSASIDPSTNLSTDSYTEPCTELFVPLEPPTAVPLASIGSDPGPDDVGLSDSLDPDLPPSSWLIGNSALVDRQVIGEAPNQQFVTEAVIPPVSSNDTSDTNISPFTITPPPQNAATPSSLVESAPGRVPTGSRSITNSDTNSQPGSTSQAGAQNPAARTARQANIQRRKARRRGQADAIGAAISTSTSIPDLDQSEAPTSPHSDSAVHLPPKSAPKRNTTGPRKRRLRAGTPEGGDSMTISPSSVTMFELASRDRRVGSKSEREKRMEAIDWSEVKRRRRDDERRMAEAGRRRPKNGDEDDQDTSQALPTAQRVQVRIVNGEHIFENLQVDRHAIANQDLDELEEFEAHNETELFNSHTYIHLKRREVAERMPSHDRWTAEATDKFFDCLSRFGTDFMVISHMFPLRTRRQIKAKYTREERNSPARVKIALENYEADRPIWSLDVFQESAGWNDYKDPRQVEMELRVIREEEEKIIEDRKKESEEIRRQRRLAGDVSDEHDGQTKALSKQSGENKKSRLGRSNAGGEEDGVEVVEIIDE